MKTNKLLVSLLAVTAVLGACQAPADKKEATKETTAETVSNKERLVMSWASDMSEVNPHLYGPNQFITQDMVYEGLVRYGDNGVIEPALAEKWDVSEDGKIYTFHLRKTNYTDGTPFTAENAKRNFDAIFGTEAKKRHNWFGLTNRLKAYKVVDEHTFQIELDRAYSAALYDLSMIRPIRFLADAGFPDGDDTSKGIKTPIGTGRWIMTEHKAGESITFKRNENYWGEKPKLKEILIKIIPDGQTRALQFESGDLDMIYGNGLISLDVFDTYKKDSKYTTAVSQPLSTRLLLLNATKPHLQDQRVREAFNHALNKKDISENIFRGTETPATTIFSKSTPHSDAGVTAYDYDMSKAEKLLDEAGWVKGADGMRQKDGQKLTMHMPYIATKVQDKDISEYLQGEWKKLGVDVQLEAFEETAYWENANTNNFDTMLTYSWGAPWDPHAWMSAMTVDSAHGHPENKAVETLPRRQELFDVINQGLVAPTDDIADVNYKKALRILHEEALYIPITYQSLISVYRTGELDGLRFMPQEHELPLRYISKK